MCWVNVFNPSMCLRANMFVFLSFVRAREDPDEVMRQKRSIRIRSERHQKRISGPQAFAVFDPSVFDRSQRKSVWPAWPKECDNIGCLWVALGLNALQLPRGTQSE